MIRLMIALQFLTVFPIKLKQMPSLKQNAESLLFYPLVGLMIGGLLFALTLVLQTLPSLVLATFILVIWIWLTGGLHLDGLADTADAWVGGFGDPERTLNIMKDPNCGPIGVLSLILISLLKLAALYLLIEMHQYDLIILIPLLGRLAPLFLFLTTPYVRKSGLGSAITEYLPRTIAFSILIITTFLSCYLSLAGSIGLASGIVTLLYLRFKFIQRIGGITGDTVGAAIEISETTILLTCALSVFYLPALV